MHTVTVFLSIGVASDNLLLSGMSGNTAHVLKTKNWLLMLFMLFTIQLQVLLYGNWLAKLALTDLGPPTKWMALGLLFATLLKMIQEVKIKNFLQQKIPLGLNGFLQISLATSVYVFVLGFSLRGLQIDDAIVYLTVIPCLSALLAAGWFAGKFQWHKAVYAVRIVSLICMAGGILILCFTK